MTPFVLPVERVLSILAEQIFTRQIGRFEEILSIYLSAPLRCVSHDLHCIWNGLLFRPATPLVVAVDVSHEGELQVSGQRPVQLFADFLSEHHAVRGLVFSERFYLARVRLIPHRVLRNPER